MGRCRSLSGRDLSGVRSDSRSGPPIQNAEYNENDQDVCLMRADPQQSALPHTTSNTTATLYLLDAPSDT